MSYCRICCGKIVVGVEYLDYCRCELGIKYVYKYGDGNKLLL